MALMLALALVAVGGSAAGQVAPTASVTGDAVCPAPAPPPPALVALQERFLTPGEVFDLKAMKPADMQQLVAFQKDATERRARDWPALCQFALQNDAVVRSGRRPRVIFMGDSITENWEKADPSLFDATTLDRGISGQTTPQMLLRMYPDVIALKPAIVHIMAGTNDISGNTGPASDRSIVDNVRAMIVLAKANGIKVILGSITPSTGFSLRPNFDPSARIVRVNALLRALATEQGAAFVDYHAPLADPRGGMRAGLANDGLHPNRAGYAIMRPITERALAQAAGRR